MRKFLFFGLIILGLGIISCTNALKINGPEPTGFYIGSDQIEGPWQMELRDNFAFLADGRNGFVVADISDPEKIFTVSRLDTDTYACPKGECFLIASKVILDQEYAYIQESNNRLMIVDISDPTDVELVTNFSLFKIPNVDWEDIAASEDHLFIATERNGLKVIDVSDKFDPMEVGQYQSSDKEMEMINLAIHEKYAFIGVKTQASEPSVYTVEIIENGEDKTETFTVYEDIFGLLILNISDPSNPSLVKLIEVDERIEDLIVDGKFAYLMLEGSMQIIDVSNPELPDYVSKLKTGFTLSATKHQNFIYAANVYNIFVIDVSDPSNPTVPKSYKISTIGGTASLDLVVRDNYLYFSGTFNPTQNSEVTDGLTIIDLEKYPARTYQD